MSKRKQIAQLETDNAFLTTAVGVLQQRVAQLEQVAFVGAVNCERLMALVAGLQQRDTILLDGINALAGTVRECLQQRDDGESWKDGPQE